MPFEDFMIVPYYPNNHGYIMYISNINEHISRLLVLSPPDSFCVGVVYSTQREKMNSVRNIIENLQSLPEWLNINPERITRDTIEYLDNRVDFVLPGNSLQGRCLSGIYISSLIEDPKILDELEFCLVPSLVRGAKICKFGYSKN